MEKRALANLPAPSTSFESDPTFTYPTEGGGAELRYEFERDGVLVRAGISFEKVRAFRFRAESHCTLWHVEGAYDTLVEVAQSAWVNELRTSEPKFTGGRWEMRHYMIYVDSGGAFEVVAASWSWLPNGTRT